MIAKRFLDYSKTAQFKAELMDLALVGDAVILFYVRRLAYNRLRFASPASHNHSEFDGRFKSNDMFIRFCREHNLFAETSGKSSADHLEAYFGWCVFHDQHDDLDAILNGYFLWYINLMKPGRVIISCPLLRQRYPLFFV